MMTQSLVLRSTWEIAKRGCEELADLSQECLAERSGVSVDVIRKLEQHRKHSVRLPTLHELATGLGVEVTGLLGDPRRCRLSRVSPPRW
jgi:transcriptional regulator with XRE-family HTH domain